MRGALLGVALLGALASLASCNSINDAARIPNPPASQVRIAVSVFDHENIHGTPSDTTFIAIGLARHDPNGGNSSDTAFKGTDSQTLVCDGAAMRLNDNFSISETYDNQYLGDVSPQTRQYTCVYLWDNGAQQAPFTIPAVIPGITHITAPTSRATVPTPGSGDPGVALTYAPQGVSVISATATATDFNRRTATSDGGPDNGSVTIAPEKFPSLYSVGWGTLTLTRSVGETPLSDVGDNAAFASVDLTLYQQVDQIAVFWL